PPARNQQRSASVSSSPGSCAVPWGLVPACCSLVTGLFSFCLVALHVVLHIPFFLIYPRGFDCLPRLLPPRHLVFLLVFMLLFTSAPAFLLPCNITLLFIPCLFQRCHWPSSQPMRVGEDGTLR